MHPIRRRQRRMRGNLPGPEGLARRGASAALHGLPVVTTTGGAARLASAPSPCQRGSREILRQAPLRPAGHKAATLMPPINQLKASIPYDTTWSPRLAPPDIDGRRAGPIGRLAR